MDMSLLLKRLTAVASAWLIGTSPLYACTGLALKAQDGAYVSGRTAEFGIQLKLGLLYMPRNMQFTGTLPDGNAGLHYTSKYATIGTNAFDQRAVLDGMNEKGLGVGAFYFPGFAQYADLSSANSGEAVAPTEFPTWILTQFASTDEVKAALDKVAIAPTVQTGWGATPPPFHYVVYDKSGKSIVIEPVGGTLKAYDNPIGVMTNSPTFDWHLVNLNNYVNLSPVGAAPKTVDGLTLRSMSTGTGLHGMPGDFSSPSRFVRAAIYSSTADPSKTDTDAVSQAFHLLNQFDIPRGAVRTAVGKNDIQVEWTLATVVRDPKNLTYYVKTFDDQDVRKVSLKELDPNAKEMLAFNLGGDASYKDITSDGAAYQGE